MAGGVQVDQVLIPATTGEFGVLPGHVPTVAQLKPGVLAVHLEADKNVKKARAQGHSRKSWASRVTTWAAQQRPAPNLHAALRAPPL